jgi:hypothetical protein
LTGFDETVRKITLNVVKGIFYLLGDFAMEHLTGIFSLVQDFAETKGLSVSVSLDGLGFDTFSLSSGEHLDTSESLLEAEMFINNL